MPSQYSYPARIERDEEGRYQVRFPDLPDALTDGADLAEALTEAVDCLSAAIASRIIDGEEIPEASPVGPGQQLVAPDPTIALKAALYTQLRQRDMTVADLADLLGMGDWHQAARLLDPRRSSKLTSLAAALGALGLRISVSVEANPAGPVQIGAAASASADAGARAAVGLVQEAMARAEITADYASRILQRQAEQIEVLQRQAEEIKAAERVLTRFGGKPTPTESRNAGDRARPGAASSRRRRPARSPD
jgi:antitoxin HicB